MRIVVTADGAGLDAPASTVFGRCRSYVFVETDSLEVETMENPAVDTASGAGIQAAQFVVEKGAKAVVTGNVGPNAYSVLQASNVPVYLLKGGTVRDVVEAYTEGELSAAGGATGPAHAGLGRGLGARQGAGRGRGSRRAATRQPISSAAGVRAEPPSVESGEQEISELEGMMRGLRKQLAEVMDRLDQLEEE